MANPFMEKHDMRLLKQIRGHLREASRRAAYFLLTCQAAVSPI
jgi:hypothetical protein